MRHFLYPSPCHISYTIPNLVVSRFHIFCYSGVCSRNNIVWRSLCVLDNIVFGIMEKSDPRHYAPLFVSRDTRKTLDELGRELNSQQMKFITEEVSEQKLPRIDSCRNTMALIFSILSTIPSTEPYLITLTIQATPSQLSLFLSLSASFIFKSLMICENLFPSKTYLTFTMYRVIGEPDQKIR